jgi:hypothetical protein
VPYFSIVVLVMRLSDTDTGTPVLNALMKLVSDTVGVMGSITSIPSVPGVNVVQTKQYALPSALIDAPSLLPQAGQAT